MRREGQFALFIFGQTIIHVQSNLRDPGSVGPEGFKSHNLPESQKYNISIIFPEFII